MSRRATAAPPRLAGYVFLRNLGSGGFADVYLYEDVRTSREVAIKVLLADSLSPGVRDQFESEARLMGRLSTHPSIVTIKLHPLIINGATDGNRTHECRSHNPMR